MSRRRQVIPSTEWGEGGVGKGKSIVPRACESQELSLSALVPLLALQSILGSVLTARCTNQFYQ